MAIQAIPILQEENFLHHMDNAHLRLVRDVNSASSDSSSSEEDLSNLGHQYRFYPYYRIRHIQKVRQPPPLSNYADSYDKFPTDF